MIWMFEIPNKLLYVCNGTVKIRSRRAHLEHISYIPCDNDYKDLEIEAGNFILNEREFAMTNHKVTALIT